MGTKRPFLRGWLTRSGVLTIGLACGLFAATAWTQVVFDNFGPGGTFNTGFGWTESGPTSGIGSDSQGERFIPALSGNLSSITIAMSHNEGLNDLHLFLSNGSGGIPGIVLESWTINNLPSFGSSYVPLVINSATHPLLSSGTVYYLYSKEPGNEWNDWNKNSNSEQGLHINSANGGPYNTSTIEQGAFRVTVEPVPEPGAFGFFACVVLTRLCRR